MPKLLMLSIRIFRILLLGSWIIATIPLLALFRLVAVSVDRVDHLLGIDDPDLLGEPLEAEDRII